MHNERILITGSKGFIGQHLLKRWDQWAPYEINRGTPWIEEDLRRWNPGIIFHLAAAGSKKGSYTEEEIYKTNLLGTWELLKATRDIPYRAFINFGSSSEYGIKDKPMREDDVLEPNFFYAATKAAATQLARNEAIENHKPVVTVRPFTIYGPSMPETKLIPTLFRKLKNGEPVRLVKGNHDYLYIDDFLDALELVVKNTSELSGQAINIGSGQQTSNYDIATLVSEVTGKGISNIIEVDRLHDHGHAEVDSLNWKANINTLRTLGWKPKVSLREGLTRIYETVK